tara:strand:- start:264 stop:1127 length:864 start_codon:yes stop_codon:yes gene_type:complete
MIKFFIFFSFLLFNKFSLADCSKAKDTSRIVVAGGSITEILFFLNESQNIVAVDTTSNYPEDAKKYPSIGYVRALSAEGVLSLNPTLIIGENDMGPKNVLEQLKKTKIELRILDEKNSIKGIEDKISCIANILGKNKIDNLSKNISLEKSISDLKKFRKFNSKKNIRGLVILMMQGTSPVVAGRNTSGGDFLKMIGSRNTMSGFEGWKPAGKEAILLSNPNFILITKRTIKNYSSLNSFLKESGIEMTEAAQTKNVYPLDGMSFLGFGPRTINSGLEISNKIYEKFK